LSVPVSQRHVSEPGPGDVLLADQIVIRAGLSLDRDAGMDDRDVDVRLGIRPHLLERSDSTLPGVIRITRDCGAVYLEGVAVQPEGIDVR